MIAANSSSFGRLLGVRWRSCIDGLGIRSHFDPPTFLLQLNDICEADGPSVDCNFCDTLDSLCTCNVSGRVMIAGCSAVLLVRKILYAFSDVIRPLILVVAPA